MAGWGYELLEQKFDFSRMGPQDKYDLADACGAYIKMTAPPTWLDHPLFTLSSMTVAAATGTASRILARAGSGGRRPQESRSAPMSCAAGH